MQTVNFQCGHCGSLMAVSVENLGQHVRCPTCQQVVIAPAAAVPEAAPESPLPVPIQSLEQGEDIFHTPAGPVDAPPGADEPPQLEPQAPPTPTPEPEPAKGLASDTLPLTPSPHGPVNHLASTLPWEPAAPPSTAAQQAMVAVSRPRQERGVSLFVPLVFIPLVLYAVAATAVAGYIYMRWQTAQPSLFDQIPDVEGDTPGARKDKKKVRLNFSREMALRPLPEHLHVKLGETIQVGDLQVTPKGVQRRKIALLAERAPNQPTPSPNDALVLTLELKNTADDYSFTPLDNYFDRAWKPGSDSLPLTVLQAGKEAFFGGPAKWVARAETGKPTSREWLVGRKNFDAVGLGPGEQAETIVATDGWNPAVSSYLFGVDAEGQRKKDGYKGKLLWRVQVRRGLVPWRGKDVPATAVIGVEFDDKAYASPPGAG